MYKFFMISFKCYYIILVYCVFFFFFFNDTATTEIYTLSLHDASSDLCRLDPGHRVHAGDLPAVRRVRQHRSEEHTSELQSPDHLVCRLLLEKKKQPLRRLSQADSELLPFALKQRSFLDLSSVACVSATECPVLVNCFRTGSSTSPTPRAHLLKINRAHSHDSSDSPRVVTTPVRFAAAADCEETALHFAAVPVWPTSAL